MIVTVLRRLFVVGIVFALPAAVYAQETVISGTVTDATGGVLPGVTVTALHEASGNTFLSVTNERGEFRIAARVGTFRITAELAGFATVTRSVEMLLGQTAELDMKMTVTGVQETVTVTGEAPLLDTSKSSLGSNIDPRQMSELPVQGRNWTTLALLAPGNRTTAMGAQPVADRQDVRDFQVNMDGVQVTNYLGPGGQPQFSRDAIAEFQFVSNRFDAVQGRSAGAQVNAITKSGTNTLTGSFGSYFRNSQWNAPDPVLNRVIPYKNQQFSGTVGGPLIRNRLHFFANYEYQREPRTTVANTPYPAFNVSLQGTNTVNIGGVRFDYQLSSQRRVMFKINLAKTWQPFGNLSNAYPSSAATHRDYTTGVVGEMTQVVTNRALNVIRAGYTDFSYDEHNLTTWSNHWMAADGITQGSPRITFTGFSIGGGQSLPWYWYQKTYSARDDFSYTYDAKGQHSLKAGGEFLWDMKLSHNCTDCMGRIDAQGGTRPSDANLQAWFPNPFNADTWNLNAIAPVVRRYTLTVGTRNDTLNAPIVGSWIQDDWKMTNRLTVNLGLRYDLIWDAFANQIEVLPWIVGHRPQDANNFQPRLGFNFQLNQKTVIRGGIGKYYGQPIAGAFTWTMRFAHLYYLAVDNDGRPDFVTNPFNGTVPSYAQARQRLCNVNNVPGCLQLDGPELAPPAQFAHLNHSWQQSIGFQRQLTSDMAFSADYVYTPERDEKAIYNNVNLGYDPLTGVNLPFATVSTRPEPTWGAIGYYAHTGYSNFRGLQTEFTKRFSHRWQMSANYLLSDLKNVSPAQPISGQKLVPFPVASDMGGEYGPAILDQRHRAVFNGIWSVGGGFEVSGVYFYGSGLREQVSCGGDRRGRGPTGSGFYVPRLCADGTIVPRNSFVDQPIQRLDTRFQQAIPVAGHVRLEGIVEVFNLFNRKNFGSYTLDKSNPQFGQPVQSTNLAYAPRTLQLGFRLAF